jgi:alkylresorcinol/alkylpyrone synthase
MSYLNSLCTGVPSHCFSQADVTAAVSSWLAHDPDLLDKLRSLISNSQVYRRYAPIPVAELVKPHAFEERNRIYIESARELGLSLARSALADAGIQAQDIDLIVTTSCTGYSLPGLDVMLANELGLRSDVKRLPFLQLGCSGGARSLAIAHDYLGAHPQHLVLVVALEFCTLTFQTDDFSLPNLVSAVIFGDGGGAAVLSGEELSHPPLCRIRNTRSHLFPDTGHFMGFDLRENGFHIVLDRDIPHFIGNNAGQLLWDFVRDNGSSLDFAAIHPGGKSVLQALEYSCEIPAEFLRPSWKILRDFGNMSSATVLFILQEVLAGTPRGNGIAAAFGPGFCLELLSLECPA